LLLYLMVWSHHVCLGEGHAPFFIAKNTLVSLLSFNECSFFSRTTFSLRFLPWFLFRSCYIFVSRYILTSGPFWFSSKELI
jgi:hypothetical protein